MKIPAHSFVLSGVFSNTYSCVVLLLQLPLRDSVWVGSRSFGSLEEYSSHSADVAGSQQRRFLLPVDSTLKTLLLGEDTDSNYQITIDDAGPKVLSVGTAGSHGFNRFDIRGTDMLSNFLQQLTLAQGFGQENLILNEARLTENSVQRLLKLTKDPFWSNLTRRIDAISIEKAGIDSKDWTSNPQAKDLCTIMLPGL